MSLWEAFRAARPPAPETPGLKRLRRVAALLCLASALLIIVLRSVGAVSLLFLAVIVLTSFAAILSTALLFRRKARREAEYWTADRIEAHRIEAYRRSIDQPSSEGTVS